MNGAATAADFAAELIARHRDVAERAAARALARLPHGVFTREELEAAALVGLWDAAKRYRPELGVKFATFAAARAAGAVQDWLREQDYLARGLRAENPEARQQSLDVPDLGRFGKDALGASLPDPAPAVDAPAELRDELRRAARGLSWRERLLVTLYYYEHLTFREIGAVLGVSESRCS